MTNSVDLRVRNQRLALALLATFALLCAGSIAYINWFDAPGTSMARDK